MNSQDARNPGPSTSTRQGDQFQRDLLALAPQLRAFSRTLCHGREIADDLAQETLMKAWRARDSFEVGTNLKAWLFTILRNCYYSHGRRAWREAHWDADAAEQIEGPPNRQDWAIELSDTARALRTLPDAQREALILVGAGGFSYEETAAICDAAVGTVKSRVARGRIALSNILDGAKSLPALLPDRTTTASDDILAQLALLATPATLRAVRL